MKIANRALTESYSETAGPSTDLQVERKNKQGPALRPGASNLPPRIDGEIEPQVCLCWGLLRSDNFICSLQSHQTLEVVVCDGGRCSNINFLAASTLLRYNSHIIVVHLK
ncbi:unnamed protein product [Rangifer tarandus platyrhynchus]|uniref:Uncharacterized protein n=1 Tax=Rangifer tarandus platyrhynchus TaxID=3082113 RepID=A0AC59ZW30_RANTA